MKKSIFAAIALVLFVGLSSFSIHKFYVSIYQINYAPEKKMLQITSRIFFDDLNDALKKKYNKATHIGETSESAEDLIVMKKYLLDNLSIKVNGKAKTIHYINKELEGNVVICYFTVKEITKIKSLEIQNTVLFDLNDEQQNIIQTSINGTKQSLLLTFDNVKGMLKQ